LNTGLQSLFNQTDNFVLHEKTFAYLPMKIKPYTLKKWQAALNIICRLPLQVELLYLFLKLRFP
jgi:hypothetical protein